MKKFTTAILLFLVLSVTLTSCHNVADVLFGNGSMKSAFAVSALSPSEEMQSCDYIETEPEPQKYTPAPIERDYHADDTFEDGTITVNDSDFTISQELTDKYFNVILEDADYPVSFYAIDIETGASFGYNADTKLPPACTIKAGVALYCLREIAAGNATFDDTIEYKRKHFVSGSGSIRERGFGTMISIRELLTLMLDESDNIAYYMLIDHFGFDGYNEMMTELGCTHHLEEGNRWTAISAHDLGLVWLEIYKFKDECDEGAFMWDLLTHNKYNEIEFALNEYMACGYETIAHKSGWSEDAFNDAGIVMADHPYVIVVMTYVGLRTYAFLDSVIYLDRLFGTYWDWRTANDDQ